MAEKELFLDSEIAEASSLYKWYLNNERWILGLFSVTIFLVIWEALGRSGLVNPIFVSSPTAIIKTGIKVFSSREIYHDLRVSGQEFIVGFGLAIITGIPIGLMAGWYRKFSYFIDPFISALLATPRLALLPLIILWFGIGIWSKVAVVFFASFFPICVNAMAGVRTVDEQVLMAARSFMATDMRIFKTVVLPSSVPFILSGLRLGVGRGLVGIVGGELFAATAGVGYFIVTAGETFETDKVFVGIIIFACAGMLCVEILKRLERRFDKWRPQVGTAI
jgi:NitT/TauT family transport system permease protein